ncbi:hypothetical protein CPHO_11870 [Corynebacterium phocae]|uniref:DUF5318 domain-containing protein n=1 Tax=Corynebacterium phocae TaxID=161895 RepID=A0A1L7D792_9CORY|nr:DUF5318 family protein [Corynebacterium phocae]APT93812.1 hypothetical protein CPHO_11870 [Corynebacterium phocae]KAA8721038.1 hypothetical protein F4V58_11325 [Corynebacterium phocae]
MDSVKTKHLVSHEWERAHVLREFRAGRVPREEICDADFLLRAAAQYHGTPAPRSCPVCKGEMKQTFWVYGQALGRRAGSARSVAEIAELAGEIIPSGQEFTVHKVEVCPHCRWNHLLETAIAC